MNADIAKTLVQNYRDNHLNVINNSKELSSLRTIGSPTDARAVWFKIDVLKQFINQIERETARNFKDHVASLGIRMYYGEYPALNSNLWGTSALPAGEPLHLERYAGMHTLLMVPTYFDRAKNIQVDFDPAYNNDGKPITMSTIYRSFSTSTHIEADTISTPGSTNAPVPAPLPPSSPVTVLNHGELVPPPYDISGSAGSKSGANFMDAADSN